MNYSKKHKITNFLILDSKAVMFLNTAIYMTPAFALLHVL